MKAIHLIPIIIALITFSCQAQENNTQTEKDIKADEQGTLYVNEYGEIHLIQVNDTIMRTIFRNNDGDEFDTVMTVDHNFDLIWPKDSLPFLHFHTGGIQMYANRLHVLEFSGIAYLGQFIRIEKIYERPFFRIGEETQIEGDLFLAKGGQIIDGIYLDLPVYADAGAYYFAEGRIKKEKYPIQFYSTDESPQGMFGDTSEVHYRLVMKNPELKKPETFTYNGTAINNSEGQACIVWDFADSESYILEGKEPWKEDEIGKEIKVNGYLVQDKSGSILKNWTLMKE